MIVTLHSEMLETPKGKVLQYESFLNETLRNDLKKLSDQRDKCFEEISQYYQLKSIIENIRNEDGKSLHAQVDIGCNFYVQAVVENPSMIFICVGFGFFVEFTHPEALKFITKKINLLEERSKLISNSMANVKAHIRMVIEALKELQILT